MYVWCVCCVVLCSVCAKWCLCRTKGEARVEEGGREEGDREGRRESGMLGL